MFPKIFQPRVHVIKINGLTCFKCTRTMFIFNLETFISQLFFLTWDAVFYDMYLVMP